MSAPTDERLAELVATLNDRDVVLGPLDIRDIEAAFAALSALRKPPPAPGALSVPTLPSAMAGALRDRAAVADPGPLRVVLNLGADTIDELASAVLHVLDRDDHPATTGEILRAALASAGVA